MKMTFELTKEEAQRLLGLALRDSLLSMHTNLEVKSVRWEKYGSEVVVEFEEKAVVLTPTFIPPSHPDDFYDDVG